MNVKLYLKGREKGTRIYRSYSWFDLSRRRIILKLFMQILLLLLLLFGIRCARPGASENTLLVQRPQLHTTKTYGRNKKKIK